MKLDSISITFELPTHCTRILPVGLQSPLSLWLRILDDVEFSHIYAA